MRIYLASRYEDRPTMLRWAETLTRMGHEITSRWIFGSHEITPDATSDESLRRFAEEDLSDLEACAVFIFHSPTAYHRTGRGGRHVELGIALARGKRIYGIGARENVFHYLPEVQWLTIDELWKILS